MKKTIDSRVFSSIKMRPVFLITATLASCLALSAKHSNLKVYGGKTANPGQFPFIVAINITTKAKEICAGSIIHENWILTTASCSVLYNWKVEELVVVSGTNQLDTDTGVLYNVSQVVIHPNFKIENWQDANIALFQIDGSFAFSDLVQTVSLGDVSVNDSVVVAGWGYAITEDNPALQYAELSVWTNEDCSKAAINSVIQPGEVCAFGGQGVGLCGAADTADPLVHDGILVGLGSWSLTPCGDGKPDVFTRVSYFQDWINNVINS